MRLKFEVDDSDYIDEPLNVSDFWEGQFVQPDQNKIDCKDCAFAMYDPCSTICKVYRNAKGKPRDIVWQNRKCKYKMSFKDYHAGAEEVVKLSEAEEKVSKGDK